MASMNNRERAQSYYERLSRTNNIKKELSEIIAEINGLIYSKDSEPISKTDKLAIIHQLKDITESNTSTFDSLTTESFEHKGFEVNASDNSDTLDIIGI